MKRLVCFSLFGVAMATFASADISLVLDSGPIVDGSNFDWRYSATLIEGSTLQTGDFFTIYDIGGFGPAFPTAANVMLPGDWSFSVQATGVNGFGQGPTDSAALFNLTFTRTGAPIEAVQGGTLLGGAGAFGYVSTDFSSRTSAFSATTHQTSGGATAGNTGPVTVAGSAVPEPSTMLLLGGGLTALQGLKRRRRAAGR